MLQTDVIIKIKEYDNILQPWLLVPCHANSFMMPGLSSPRRGAEWFWWMGWDAKLPWKERSQRKCVHGFPLLKQHELQCKLPHNLQCWACPSVVPSPSRREHEQVSGGLASGSTQGHSHYHRDLKWVKSEGAGWLFCHLCAGTAFEPFDY